MRPQTADANRATNDGTTALMAAAQAGQAAVVQLLLSKGATPTQVNGKGQRALEYARAGNHKDVVEVLLPLTPGDAPPPPINQSVASKKASSTGSAR